MTVFYLCISVFISPLAQGQGHHGGGRHQDGELEAVPGEEEVDEVWAGYQGRQPFIR